MNRGAAGRGRPKGSQNKATKELKEFWSAFFRSKPYRESAKARIVEGKAPHLESYLLALIHGRPTEHVALEDADGHVLVSPVTFIVKRDAE